MIIPSAMSTMNALNLHISRDNFAIINLHKSIDFQFGMQSTWEWIVG